MINSSTLEAVYPLAEKLAKRGIKITPHPTTPVDQLQQVAHRPVPSRLVDSESASPVDSAESNILQGSMMKDAMGVCRHDVVMEEVADVVADTVRRNLDLARNVINPMVKAVAQETEEYVQAAESVKKTYVSVVPVFYRSIWDTQALGEMVARYDETPVVKVALNLVVPYAADRDSLLDLAKTGARRFDEEVEAFFESLPENFPEETYRMTFGVDRSLTLDDVAVVSDAISNQHCLDRALLIHLFSRKLMQNVPEGVPASLDDYRNYMANLISQTGRIINGIMRRRELAIKQRQLVVYWPMGLDRLGGEPINIPVNGDVYKEWLSKGGEPDAIIGAYIGDQEKGFTALLEKKESYIADWERRSRVLGTTQRLQRFNHAVEGMAQAVTRQINDMDEEQLPVPREVLHQRLKDHLSMLHGNFYDRVYDYARKLVCTVIFPHTMGLKILCAIDNVAKDYPDIEVREAALLATIEIVAEWVAKLCKVEHLAVN